MSKAYEERQVNGHCKKRNVSCPAKGSTKPKNGIRTLDKTPGKKKVIERRRIVYLDESENSSSSSQSSDAGSDDSASSEGWDDESDCSTSSFEIVEATNKRSRSSSKENDQKKMRMNDSSQEEEGEGEEYSVEEILDMKLDKDGKEWFLIKWWNYGSNDNTWEPIENLSKCQEMVDEFLERRNRRKSQEARMVKGISGKRKRFKTKRLSNTDPDHSVDEQSVIKAVEDELLEKQNTMKAIGEELLKKQNTMRPKPADELLGKQKTMRAKPGDEMLEKQNTIRTISVDELLEKQKPMRPKPGDELLEKQNTIRAKSSDELLEKQKPMRPKPGDELLEKQNTIRAKSSDELLEKQKPMRAKPGDELLEKQNTIRAKSGDELSEKQKMTRATLGDELLEKQNTIRAKSGEELSEKQKMTRTTLGEELLKKQKTMRATGLKVMNLKNYSTKENLDKKDVHETANGLSSSSFLQNSGFTWAKLQPTVKLNKIEPPQSTIKCNGGIEDSASTQQSQQALEIASNAAIPQEPSIPYKVNPDIVELSIPNDFTRLLYPGSLYYFKIINGDKSDFLLIDYTKPLTEADADDYYKCVVTEDLTGKEVKLVYGATKSVDGDTFCLVQFEGYSYVEVIPPENLFQKYPAFRRFFEVHCPHLFTTNS